MEVPIGLNAIWALRDNGKVFADTDRGIFQCNSCGAHFRHGDCWLHTPTGHYVFFGQTCGDKYGFLAERDEWEMELKETKARKATLIQEQLIQERQESILTDNPGILEAFDNQSHFIQKIKEQFERGGYLSSKQIVAVLEAHKRSKTQNKIAALDGKQAVTGTILSCKVSDNGFGGCVKMTVKVGDDSGFYLVWGTLPTKLYDAMTDVFEKTHDDGHGGCYVNPDLVYFKGFQVSFTATFTVSPKDESFAFFKRPSKVSLVSTEKVEV